jgi:hypothetical protein
LTLGKSVSVGQLPLVKGFLKGVYNKRPISQRYQQTWDVNLVFTWSSSMFINVKSKLCNVCTLCPLIRANRITNFNDKVLKDKIFTGDNVFK